MMVVWLFPSMPGVFLQFVIEVFPDHSHLLFLYQTDNGGFGQPYWNANRVPRSGPMFSFGQNMQQSAYSLIVTTQQ